MIYGVLNSFRNGLHCIEELGNSKSGKAISSCENSYQLISLAEGPGVGGFIAVAKGSALRNQFGNPKTEQLGQHRNYSVNCSGFNWVQAFNGLIQLCKYHACRNKL